MTKCHSFTPPRGRWAPPGVGPLLVRAAESIETGSHRARLLVAVLCALVVPGVARAQPVVWGQWTAGSSTSASVSLPGIANATVTFVPTACGASTSLGAASSLAHGVVPNFPNSWYTPTPPNPASWLNVTAGGNVTGTGDCNNNPVVGTMTIQFDAPVTNPVMHFLNSDAGEYRFLDGVSVTRLSGNPRFVVAGSNVNSPPAIANQFGCQAADGTNPTGGCGSVRLNGTFTQVRIDVTDLDATVPGGDGHLITMSATESLDCGTGTPQTISGAAQAWTPDSVWQAFEPVNAINSPDGIGVQLHSANNSVLTLDTATVVSEGEAVTLHMSQLADPNYRGNVLIESSADGVTFGNAVTYGPGASLPAFETFTYTVPAGGLRFVRITPQANGLSGTAVQVDALTYSFQYCECGGATNSVQQNSFEEFELCSMPTDAFGAWRVIEDSVHIWGQTCQAIGWPAPDGEKSMDLDGLATGGAEQTITGLNPGQRYNLTFYMGFNSAAGAQAASMRLRIGDFDRIYTSASSATIQYNRVYVEFTARSTTETLRFESLTGRNDPTLLSGGGTSGYGVVIDDVRITTKYCDDYGDAPATYGSAWHTAAGPTLGALRDNEETSQASFDARGDDLSGNDEDGLVSIDLQAGATTASAVVNATNPTATDAMLAGWVDFDNNGLFEPPERMHVIVPANTVAPMPFTLTWINLAPIPAGFTSFARFRIAHNESELFTSGGGATAGEVEDYAVPIATNTTSELLITKAATPNPVAPGEPLTYTITVANNGPASVLGARVSDPLPAELAAFTWTCAQPTGACSPGSGTGAVDTLVNLAPGTQAVITLTGTLPSTASSTLQNTVTLTPPVNITPTCPAGNPNCLTSTITVDVTPRYDLGVTKTVDDPTPSLNQRVTFTITTTNSGPSDALDVRVTDPLPEGLMLVTATPTIGAFDAATGLWQIGTLTPAEPAILRVVAVVTRTGTLRNTATILPPSGGGVPIDDNPGNDISTIEIPVDGTDVETTRVWWLYNPEQDTLDFYTDLTNVGGQPTSGPITVVIPLPQGIAFHMGPGDWTCEVVGDTNSVACTRADLALQPGEQLTLPLWTRGVPPASASIYAHVTYAADTNVANNVALLWPCCGGVDRNVDPSRTPVPVVPVVEAARAAAMLPETVPAETIELVVAQQAPAVSMADGARQLTYAITLTNQGPRDAVGLTVSDAIPTGATVVSATAAGGACATGAVSVVCQWDGLPVGQTAQMTVVLASTEVSVLTHTVSASAVDPEGVLTNNQTVLSTPLPADPALDTDADGLPNAWETTMGLDPAVADANGDDDGDGVTNLEEYVRGTHPRGFFRRYFAEGVSNGFFATELAVVNPDPAAPATVVLTGQREGDGYQHSHVRQLGAMSRYQVTGTDVLSGSGSFSTLLESDVPVAADRIIYWDAHRYGSSVESALPEPSTTWYFAEGATHGFSLYYLLQNPDATRTAQVQVSYLLPSGLPVVKTYTVAPHSRFTIPVHHIPELEATDVSASLVSTNGVPIVAERAMYRDGLGQTMNAGHASAGAPRSETSWFFAEGATGSFFNLYLLLANPELAPAQVTARYQLPDGTSFTIAYDVAPQSRRTISVAEEDPRLANTSVAITLTSTTPIVAERAMWWPGPSVSPEWYEAHDSLGATTTGTKWAVAGGSAGGPDGESTFILIANQADVAGSATVTVIYGDGTRAEKAIALAPTSRVTVDVAAEFPEAAGRTFSAIVESTGGTPVPLVVESARYGSPRGVLWGAGGAALATKLQ